MRAAVLGLFTYAAYAAVVGVLFTQIVAGLLQSTPARAGASPHETVILVVTTADSTAFTVECHTTSDRVTSDTLALDPGEVGQAYRELGCA